MGQICRQASLPVPGGDESQKLTLMHYLLEFFIYLLNTYCVDTHLPENVDILGHEKNMTINEEALSSCSGVREEEQQGAWGEQTWAGT